MTRNIKNCSFLLKESTAALKSKTSPEKGWSGEDVKLIGNARCDDVIGANIYGTGKSLSSIRLIL